MSAPRIRAQTRHLADVADAIARRAARAAADASTPRRPTPGERRDPHRHADPTQDTAVEIVTRLDEVAGSAGLDTRLRDDDGAPLSLRTVTDQLHRIAAWLGYWADAQPPEGRCRCPRDCCPDGCGRPSSEGRRWHDTCRKRRDRARQRGEPWAQDDAA